MIKWTSNYFKDVPPVFVDGAAFVLIQMLTFLTAAFGGDEAAKYISPKTLFWLKLIVGELAAGFLAFKMFRSTAYSQSIQDKKDAAIKTWTAANGGIEPSAK